MTGILSKSNHSRNRVVTGRSRPIAAALSLDGGFLLVRGQPMDNKHKKTSMKAGLIIRKQIVFNCLGWWVVSDSNARASH